MDNIEQYDNVIMDGSCYMIKIIGEYGISIESYKQKDNKFIQHGLFTFYDPYDKKYHSYIQYLDGVKLSGDITQIIYSNRTEYFTNNKFIGYNLNNEIRNIPDYVIEFIKSDDKIKQINI